MDKSNEYIKMCREAREIQSGQLHTSGDFVYSHLKKKIVVLYYSLHHGNPPKHYIEPETSTWLPRQDQLQKMLSKEWNAGNVLEFGLYPLHGADYLHDSKTFEDAWLRQVMREKYNKVWNGKTWVAFSRLEGDNIDRQRKCEKCDGTGNIDEGMYNCPKCGGAGSNSVKRRR
jgi:hypothetical protein